MTIKDNYPGVSHYHDRHGRKRWRFRTANRSRDLQGEPYEPEFDQSYSDAVAGRKPRPKPKPRLAAFPKDVVRPKSFADAWDRYKKYDEWRTASTATRSKNEYLAEAFLKSEIEAGTKIYWRQALVSDLRRTHVKKLLAKYGETPHKAKHMLTAVRKMIIVALDEEWIEHDPSAKIGWRPAYKGWSAWNPSQLQQFMERWPAGTTPHLVFSIALWLGNRRSDIATLRWDQRCARKLQIAGDIRIVRGFEIVQKKTGKVLFLPEPPMLTAAIDATERRGDTIVVTAYGLPFSEKSLTGRMSDWRQSADLPKGLTLHGLRKTLGKLMAEGGTSTRQLMSVLGHENLEHAELYSRDAEQAVMAVEAMDKVVALFERN